MDAIAKVDIASFDFEALKADVKSFTHSLQWGSKGTQYLYSKDCDRPTLYGSVYACMTLSLLGGLQQLSPSKKKQWIDYFDSFQNAEDGLFYDPRIMNDQYCDSDWWGARHLALHIVSAYTDLGARPKYSFKFLSEYYDNDRIAAWLDHIEWDSVALGDSDVDNKIMNIGCLLQYQRDYWADDSAAAAVEFLKQYLRSRINKHTGIWGVINTRSKAQRSRMVQFAYHLFPLFFYDNEFDFDHARIVANVLQTQNKYGGYGVTANSSACEDIDSVYILVKLYAYSSQAQQAAIDDSLNKAFRWLLINQVDDGGFVFRLFEEMRYGHDEMFSSINSGALFPTWFRLLSIAYITNRLTGSFNIGRTPGLVF